MWALCFTVVHTSAHLLVQYVKMMLSGLVKITSTRQPLTAAAKRKRGVHSGVGCDVHICSWSIGDGIFVLR